MLEISMKSHRKNPNQQSTSPQRRVLRNTLQRKLWHQHSLWIIWQNLIYSQHH